MHEPVLAPARMAAADAATIAAGTPGAVLMARAGRACFDAAVAAAGGAHRRHVVVLAGPGNNGGDGFCIAHHFRHAGAAVRCILLGDPDAVRGDAAGELARMRAAGVQPEVWTGELPAADIVIDALFGTGFRGALDGAAAEIAVAVAAARSAGSIVVAVDICSGVNGATGEIDSGAISADVCVAIEAHKLGHVLDPGARAADRVVCAHIGIDVGTPDAWLADPATAVRAVPERAPDAHKWSAGAVLVAGGAIGMSGAPRLVAYAAFRAGAGLVVAAVPSEIIDVVAAAHPEVMTCALPEGRVVGGADGFDPDWLARFGAVAIGPGLGRSDRAAALTRGLLAAVEGPVVLDADGLNAIGPAELADRRDLPTVITPHDGEFARLGGDRFDADAPNRCAAVAAAAEAWGVTILRKGPATIVAAPGSVPVIVRGGGPELATAGSGDTLSGIIAAYLARGAAPVDAAVAAAGVHAAAGARAAADGRWVIAGDLAEHLGAAERNLRAETT